MSKDKAVTSLMIHLQVVALLCLGKDSCIEERTRNSYLFVFLRSTRTTPLSIYYCTVVITMAMVVVRVVQSGNGIVTSPVFLGLLEAVQKTHYYTSLVP